MLDQDPLLGRVIADPLKIGSLQLGPLSGIVFLFALVALSLAGGAYNPFIYFRF